MKRTAADKTNIAERRIWRLAYLLTGDPERAAGVVTTIVRSRHDAAELDPAGLDRLVVQHAREWSAGRLGSIPITEASFPGATGAVRQTLAALAELPMQSREAWVLARLDEVDKLWMSRAMDCSNTAAGRFLDAADAHMRTRLGPGHDAAVARTRAWADTFNPVPVLAAERARRDAARRLRLAAAVLAAVIVVFGAVWMWLTRGAA